MKHKSSHLTGPTSGLVLLFPLVFSLLFSLFFSLLFALPLQADDEWSFGWKNGFKLANDEAGHSLKFGGRIQADYQFADSDDFFFEDGFEFRRARLFFSGTLYERMEFKAQYDFAGSTEIKDLWIAFRLDWGKVKFGHAKEPFGLSETTSSNYITFLERPLPVLAFSPARNSGVMIEGRRGDRLNWGAGAYYDADGVGESISENDHNVTARIGFRPLWKDGGKSMVHLGGSVSFKERESSLRFRARPENHIGGRLLDTGTFPAESVELLGAEVAVIQGPFWVSGEYIGAEVDAPAVGDPSFGGFYVQAGYFLTGEHRSFKTSNGSFTRIEPKQNLGQGRGAWELKARWSTLDLTDAGIVGGEEDNLSIGVNWYPNPATRLMLDYVDADVEGAGDASFFLARLHLDF